MSDSPRTQQVLVGALAVAVILGMLLWSVMRPPPPRRPAVAVADVEYLTPFGAPSRPFSPAVRVGNLIFLSGQIATEPDATGPVVAGGIEAETRKTLENIRAVLDSVGSGMDRVIKCTVMMADMREWDRMNSVYREFFPEGRLPARAAVESERLALGARVEMDCIATR